MSKIIVKPPALLLFCLFSLSQSTESVYTTGLPQISLEFNIDAGLAQTSSSVYFLGFAVGIFVLGSLSDLYGRRPVAIFGLTLFLITSICSFFANNVYMLIFLRFLQAFGASVGSVVAQAIARDSYKDIDLSKLYATLAAGIAITPAFGSLIGGYIVELLGWRYNFLYLFSVVFLVYLGLIFKLPETNMNKGKTDHFSEIFRVMIKDKKLILYGSIIGIFNGIMYSFFIEAPFIFISKLHFHPSNYGFIILALSVAGMVGSIISRQVQKHIDGEKIIEIGLMLSLLSCAIFAILGILWAYNYIPNETIRVILITPIIFQSISFSVVMPLVLRYSLQNYTKINGTAGSIFGTFYYIIIALINFITTRIHSDTITNFTIFILLISLSSYILYRISKKIPYNSSTPYRG